MEELRVVPVVFPGTNFAFRGPRVVFHRHCRTRRGIKGRGIGGDTVEGFGGERSDCRGFSVVGGGVGQRVTGGRALRRNLSKPACSCGTLQDTEIIDIC